IERTYRRPLGERALRALLAFVLPSTARFRTALRLAALARPFRSLLPRRLQGLIDTAAAARRVPSQRGQAAAPPSALGTLRNGEPIAGTGAKIKRVALLPGCVQPALRPDINAAAIRVLNRFGVEVVVAPGTGCCGALVHHMGREHASSAQAKADIDAWTREIESRGLDAIIVTASGCGTMLKDYAFLFRNDPAYAAKAARVSALARDVSEVLADVMSLASGNAPAELRVAYHSACSLQHGQNLHALGPDLLRKAGFTVLDIPESHICCGSAGTYSLLQPEM